MFANNINLKGKSCMDKLQARVGLDNCYGLRMNRVDIMSNDIAGHLFLAPTRCYLKMIHSLTIAVAAGGLNI